MSRYHCHRQSVLDYVLTPSRDPGLGNIVTREGLSPLHLAPTAALGALLAFPQVPWPPLPL